MPRVVNTVYSRFLSGLCSVRSPSLPCRLAQQRRVSSGVPSFGAEFCLRKLPRNQVRGTPPLSMVAYWAVNRHSLQEAAAADSGTDTANSGSAATGDGCGGGTGEANGWLGVSGKEEEGGEGIASQQERVFLSIVARYCICPVNHSSFHSSCFICSTLHRSLHTSVCLVQLCTQRFMIILARPVLPPARPPMRRSYANLSVSSFGGDGCAMMDDGSPPPSSDERNTRFKLIPRVIGGPWMVRKAIGSTPVLLGTKITHR